MFKNNNNLNILKDVVPISWLRINEHIKYSLLLDIYKMADENNLDKDTQKKIGRALSTFIDGYCGYFNELHANVMLQSEIECVKITIPYSNIKVRLYYNEYSVVGENYEEVYLSYVKNGHAFVLNDTIANMANKLKELLQ